MPTTQLHVYGGPGIPQTFAAKSSGATPVDITAALAATFDFTANVHIQHAVQSTLAATFDFAANVHVQHSVQSTLAATFDFTATVRVDHDVQVALAATFDFATNVDSGNLPVGIEAALSPTFSFATRVGIVKSITAALNADFYLFSQCISGSEVVIYTGGVPVTVLFKPLRHGIKRAQKDLDESFRVFFEFGDDLGTNPVESLQTISGTAVSPSGALTIGSAQISGTQVQAITALGGDLIDYSVTATVTTNRGQTLEAIGVVEVRSRTV